MVLVRKILILTIVFFACFVYSSDVYPQMASKLFVVYGTVYGEGHIIIEGDYIIEVINITKGIEKETQLGIGSDAGKFCVVFINYEGGEVISDGDVIRISARKMYLNADGRGKEKQPAILEHVVTAEEVINMKVMIDIYLNEISIRSISWGDLKEIYK